MKLFISFCDIQSNLRQCFAFRFLDIPFYPLHHVLYLLLLLILVCRCLFLLLRCLNFFWICVCWEQHRFWLTLLLVHKLIVRWLGFKFFDSGSDETNFIRKGIVYVSWLLISLLELMRLISCCHLRIARIVKIVVIEWGVDVAPLGKSQIGQWKLGV